MPDGLRTSAVLWVAVSLAEIGCEQSKPAPAVRQPVATSAVEPGRHVEPAGRFSYTIPDGWTTRKIAGLTDYHILFGPPGETYVPNANFQHENYSGTLDDYVALNIQGLKDGGLDFQITQQPEPFTTDTQLEGRRLIIDLNDDGQRVRQTFFFIRHPPRMYVITASALSEGGEAFDGLFDALAKSLRPEKS